MNTNQRKHPRVRIPLLVQYRTSPLEEFRTEYASDVSEGGIFLSATESFPVGTVLFMQFVTRDGMHLIGAEARVVRKAEGGGNGMQFVRLEQADLEALHALIEKVRAREEKGRR